MDVDRRDIAMATNPVTTSDPPVGTVGLLRDFHRVC